MASSQGLDSELESFRRQWLSEVRTKQGPPRVEETVTAENSKAPPRRAPSPSDTRTAATAAPAPSSLQAQLHDEEDPSRSVTLDEASAAEQLDTTLEGSVRPPPSRELVSALDHYEEAMAKEAEGNMGDSLMLYRRAYRLDHRVDRRYREKHFPASHQSKKQAPAQHASASTSKSTAVALQSSTTSAAPAQIASSKPDPASAPEPAAVVILPTEDLIASFSNLQIRAAPPAIEDTPPDPCPISALPRELLVHILREVALHDVGDFARLSLVCKPLAYLVTTSQHIWRDVCLGPKFGFSGMHYHWHKTTDWGDLSPPSSSLLSPLETGINSSDVLAQRRKHSTALSKALVGTPEFPSWKHMFRTRPRIRFNGCYISTVNYIRMGQASTNQATWGGSPVHIVTYYRYLRFFRDGTAISLLTTWEPSAVVGHLTREMLRLHQPQHQHRDNNAHASLPSAVMQKAYKGRWRLSSCCCSSLDDDHEDHCGDPEAHDPERRCSAGEDEADLTVETETHDPKYMFRMDLSLRTAGKAARNNKLVWRSHFSYNRLADDWAEFTLKHDKAFFFSRVRSYGMGW
ncbi:hypothetical protein E4U17_005153 [Claviceps sp. LM77 group G4]|nr:hypothetical protein E4U17_005153 [Claviceps sp. LM77 group G4]KAG6067559.1 hypothetical protein E4U33_005258 [Claviceps sp. LM78 group G4]